MKRWMGMLLLIAVLAASANALAGAKLSEATMIYEDYDGNHADWTVNDDGELKELVEILNHYLLMVNILSAKKSWNF